MSSGEKKNREVLAMTGKEKDIAESYMLWVENIFYFGFDAGLSIRFEDIEYQLIGLIKEGVFDEGDEKLVWEMMFYANKALVNGDYYPDFCEYADKLCAKYGLTGLQGGA